MAFGNTHKGKYTLKKPEKYIGDPNNVVYRSSWERGVFRWCERNDNVVQWAAEELAIPYEDAASQKRRRYFIDVYIKFKDGTVKLIEIKPEAQTKPPKSKRRTKRLIEEQKTFVTNQCKWTAANDFAKRRGWKFEVWTEKTLKSIGAIKW